MNMNVNERVQLNNKVLKDLFIDSNSIKFIFQGLINFEDGKVFQVESVQNCDGYIMHSGSFLTPNAVVSANEKAIMKIDRIHRMSNMKNHSSTHILNAAIKKVLPTSTICQKSSRVTANDLKFDIFVFGKLLTSDCIDNIEEIVRDVIDRNIIVNTHVINENDLLVNDVVLLPGEIYPANGIRLVEIVNSDFQSRYVSFVCIIIQSILSKIIEIISKNI